MEDRFFKMSADILPKSLADDLGLETQVFCLFIPDSETFVTCLSRFRIFENYFFFGIDSRKFAEILKKLEELEYVEEFNPLKEEKVGRKNRKKNEESPFVELSNQFDEAIAAAKSRGKRKKETIKRDRRNGGRRSP